MKRIKTFHIGENLLIKKANKIFIAEVLIAIIITTTIFLKLN